MPIPKHKPKLPKTPVQCHCQKTKKGPRMLGLGSKERIKYNNEFDLNKNSELAYSFLSEKPKFEAILQEQNTRSKPN